ncbi:MAG TPA: hypothetical protein PLD92_04805 [Candidatus Omnitrophota bacterium]|nr:hypothetical protein [Candidatus Omnitrophota bacterium]
MDDQPRAMYKTRVKPKENPGNPIEALIKYRVDNKLTYTKLAERLHVSDGLIKGVVYGANRVTPAIALKFAKLVGADPKMFLTWALEQLGVWNKNWEIVEKTKRIQDEIHTKPE